MDRATRIELHDGYIRFVGTKLQPDGSEVEGSLDLRLTAENAQLKAKIIAVDIPGVDLNNRCVTESNEELEYAFTHKLDLTPGEVLFKEVTVEEGVLRMKYRWMSSSNLWIQTQHVVIPHQGTLIETPAR